ncbi:MAG: lytic transglycosylase domain-containing protein [Vampirovibrio sp.]|nr:lytic transglycosylase domain-containing protein [Vampirovibrio sp.]
MTLVHLQQTLNRIQDIEQRLGGLGLSTDRPTSTQGAEAFEAVLNQIQPPKESVPELKNYLEDLVERQAGKEGLDPNLVKALVQTESAFNPKAVSKAGAMGLMQLMPGTANELGVKDAFNPVQNINGGTKYLKTLMGKYDSVPKALAAYNAGPGAVDKYSGIPPYKETQNYVQRIMSLQKQYAAQDAQMSSISAGGQ